MATETAFLFHISVINHTVLPGIKHYKMDDVATLPMPYSTASWHGTITQVGYRYYVLKKLDSGVQLLALGFAYIVPWDLMMEKVHLFFL